ncbi:M48 family metallopeptidase [Pseudodesulfovibrio pelocollis]|uniref:M48 family metallopeptidase n=1 Tax=Pseudodesulfovibrio pelocollis TaxID=3051432 RepID=UPI00255AA402|nr:SprT family zinc-dependent metalloprotease [Pseudodesulfovibrio sp. SB368]
MTRYCGLPLTVRAHPSARRVLVKLVPGRGLEVVVPRGFDQALVEDILDARRPWIERTRAAMEARGTDLTGQAPALPETVEYRALGRCCRVDALHRPGRAEVVENGPRLMVRGPQDDPAALIEALALFTARKAREFLLPRLDAASRRLAMPYSAMRVRRQRTRWGSCSSRGVISLNAKLLFLPPELVDHLLLHELCHTRHLNHSDAYWALVASHQPDYERLERALTRAVTLVPPWLR